MMKLLINGFRRESVETSRDIDRFTIDFKNTGNRVTHMCLDGEKTSAYNFFQAWY